MFSKKPFARALDVCVQKTISETSRPKDANQYVFYDDLYDFTRENHNHYNKVFIDDRIP